MYLYAENVIFGNNSYSENVILCAKIYAENVISPMEMLERKIDAYLSNWKRSSQRKPLIVKGARQIGKTESIRAFGKANYESVIEINFVLLKKFRAIFDDGYEVDTIIKNISLIDPSLKFIPYKTLLFFDDSPNLCHQHTHNHYLRKVAGV